MDITHGSELPQEIIFLIHAKAYEFQGEGVQKIDASDIKAYLFEVAWRNKQEVMLCDMIDDIMSLRFSALFDFLKAKVIKEAREKHITDFNDLIFK